MIDHFTETYPYIQDEKGLHPDIFYRPDIPHLVVSGSGRTLIVDTSPTKLSIIDGIDYIRFTEDMDIQRPRRLIAEVSDTGGDLHLSLDVVTRIPEDPTGPHPDFFAARFAIEARKRFERTIRRSISYFTSDCEQWSDNYRQFEELQKQGRDREKAFWSTWIGGLSNRLGFTELKALSSYTDSNGVKAFSFSTRTPTPTP